MLMSKLEDLKKQIEKHHRRLQKLKEQRAEYGIDTRPHILTEIEDIEAEIEELQTEVELKRREDSEPKPILTKPPFTAAF